jgi:hypothetical protein
VYELSGRRGTPWSRSLKHRIFSDTAICVHRLITWPYIITCAQKIWAWPPMAVGSLVNRNDSYAELSLK